MIKFEHILICIQDWGLQNYEWIPDILEYHLSACYKFKGSGRINILFLSSWRHDGSCLFLKTKCVFQNEF